MFVKKEIHSQLSDIAAKYSESHGIAWKSDRNYYTRTGPFGIYGNYLVFMSSDIVGGEILVEINKETFIPIKLSRSHFHPEDTES